MDKPPWPTQMETAPSPGGGENLPVAPVSWLESKLKPKTIHHRYPFRGKPLLWMTCAFGSLGDALFGYDQGIVSGLLVNPVFLSRFFSDYGGADGTDDDINPSVTGILVSCLQVSAAIGSLIAGSLGDMIGRKKCVRLGGFIYFVTAFIQAFAPDFKTFVIGRTLRGLGVGFLSMTVPVIQTEIAAPHRRGLMVGVEYTFLIGGYALSTWVDFGFYYLIPKSESWQGPYFIQMGLAFILFAMSFILPETPRWLARNGFTEECLQTVADLHTPDGDTQAHHVQPQRAEVPAANPVPYVAATIFTWWLADKWGRRPLLILGGILMAITLCIVCAFTEAHISDPNTRAHGIYAFVMIYNAIYGFTWGPMFNFAIGMSAPDAFAGIEGYYYVIIAGFCLISVALAYFFYVETANHTLEEIALAFGDKAFAVDDETVVATAHLGRETEERKSALV
ncbi:hypothetical protein QQX98_002355 [Neonectria punicea]|uniref:Major facilitator superfamily (MFS) profile domain-containing protein n=1 Tax=Neonectria punicea TaxID=979145 RepID=A0ABR1HJ44_9HYPO